MENVSPVQDGEPDFVTPGEEQDASFAALSRAIGDEGYKDRPDDAGDAHAEDQRAPAAPAEPAIDPRRYGELATKFGEDPQRFVDNLARSYTELERRLTEVTQAPRAPVADQRTEEDVEAERERLMSEFAVDPIGFINRVAEQQAEAKITAMANQQAAVQQQYQRDLSASMAAHEWGKANLPDFDTHQVAMTEFLKENPHLHRATLEAMRSGRPEAVNEITEYVYWRVAHSPAKAKQDVADAERRGAKRVLENFTERGSGAGGPAPARNAGDSVVRELSDLARSKSPTYF